MQQNTQVDKILNLKTDMMAIRSLLMIWIVWRLPSPRNGIALRRPWKQRQSTESKQIAAKRASNQITHRGVNLDTKRASQMLPKLLRCSKDKKDVDLASKICSPRLTNKKTSCKRIFDHPTNLKWQLFKILIKYLSQSRTLEASSRNQRRLVQRP